VKRKARLRRAIRRLPRLHPSRTNTFRIRFAPAIRSELSPRRSESPPKTSHASIGCIPTLRIPNPYEAQQKSLEAQVEQLSAQAHDSESKLDATKNQVLSLSEHNAELTAENASLKDTVKVMPWWRATSLGAGAAALLMLGVTILTLFEWWSLRRRFLALSGLAESLGHLDVKYKEMLAKAELRMQQLYGRRRPGMPDTSAPVAAKTAEEIEIERLNIRLRETLEHHLERLGAGPRSKGRARWREVIGADEPAEAPSRR